MYDAGGTRLSSRDVYPIILYHNKIPWFFSAGSQGRDTWIILFQNHSRILKRKFSFHFVYRQKCPFVYEKVSQNLETSAVIKE